MARKFAVANQKGGVGKTTTAINLGTALAAVEEKVLIIDLDPQGNAGTGFGIDPEDRHISTYDVLTGKVALVEAIMPTSIPNLHIAPSTLDLLGLENEISAAGDRAFRLQGAVAELEADGAMEDYSYIIIDCPPSLNLLTINAMTAADAVLVPLQCEFFALEGLAQLMGTIEEVRETLNPSLGIQGVVLTMYDQRNNLANQVVSEVRGVLGSKVYEVVIPRNVRISESPSFGKPVLLYDHKCAGSQAYIDLASEIIEREKQLNAA
jgi:chromosome partitioning protein